MRTSFRAHLSGPLASGRVQDFLVWTFSYARQYSSLVSLKDGWDLFTYHAWPILRAAPGIWSFALMGLALLFWHPAARRHAVLIVGLLVFSFLGVSSGLYFRYHYFILVLPAIALLTGAAISVTVGLLEAKWVQPAVRVLPVLVFFAAFSWAIKNNAQYYFSFSPLKVCQEIYVNSPFADAITIGDYLKQHTSSTDRIAVLGSEPEIFFYSQRRSATGYIYVYALMENQSYWQQMQRQMIDEIGANRPTYIVYVSDPLSWLTTVGSSRMVPFFNWAKPYIKEHYEQVGWVDLSGSGSRIGVTRLEPPTRKDNRFRFSRAKDSREILKEYVPQCPVTVPTLLCRRSFGAEK